MGEEMSATQPPMVRQDPKAWEAGYNAGFDGKTRRVPAGVDGLSFSSGLIEGEADRKQGRRRNLEPTTLQP